MLIIKEIDSGAKAQFIVYALILATAILVTAGAQNVAVAQSPASPSDPTASFFMGRIKYSRNNGNDCSGVGRNLAKLVSEVSTIRIGDEERIAFTDPQLFETPFLFMNGHNDFVLGDEELDSLRVYLEHGGFLFVSGCCTNPAFPKAWRREMARVFPGTETR